MERGGGRGTSSGGPLGFRCTLGGDARDLGVLSHCPRWAPGWTKGRRGGVLSRLDARVGGGLLHKWKGGVLDKWGKSIKEGAKSLVPRKWIDRG